LNKDFEVPLKQLQNSNMVELRGKEGGGEGKRNRLMKWPTQIE
jgi:hypothetical protein